MLKDVGFPEVKYLQPTIKKVQLQNEGREWITIWSNPEGKALKLTPDGAEKVLDTVSVEAGTYVATRLLVSTIDVEVDINRDGDTLDKHQEVILTEEEFNNLPQQQKPSAPNKPSEPSEPTASPEPSKPEEPSQPPEPTAPSKPVGDKPQGEEPGEESPEPSEPTAPSEPSKPEEPSQPSQGEEPSQPPEPTAPSEPEACYKIVKGLVHTCEFLDEKHTATPPFWDGIDEHKGEYLYPVWKNDFLYNGISGKIIYDFTLHPLKPKHEQISVEVSTESPPPLVPTLSALVLSSASAISHTILVGTVTLSSPAPAGGQIVQLSATPSGALRLPESVTVKAGETSGTFKISSYNVIFPVNVTITATLNESQKTALLTVSPNTVSSLTLSPASVSGGKSSVCTVTLNAARGRQFVRLSASPGAPVSIPLSIHVGGLSRKFHIQTRTVTSPVNVTITATLNNLQQTALLTVNPTPIFVFVSPKSVIGGDPSVGTVTLSDPAPAGDQVVQLSATPGGSLTLPESVTVKAGETSGTFNITTKIVTSYVITTITAKISDSQENTSLRIDPRPYCTDSDNGKNYQIKGHAEGFTPTGSSSGNDYCQHDRNGKETGKLTEWYCLTTPMGDMIRAVVYDCPNGCSDGACLPAHPILLSLTVSPVSVLGSESSTGTVTLGGPAPSGGQIVQLSATPSDSLTLPESVTVKAGETSGTFNIATNMGGGRVNVAITAKVYNSQKTTSITINPMPRYCPYTCRLKCKSNEFPVQSYCHPVTQYYSCGFFGWWTCHRTAQPICCKPK